MESSHARIRAGRKPMRFYNGAHQHWCGIDLHARTMYLCLLDRDGQVLVHRNLPSRPEAFLEAIHGGKAKNHRIDAFKIATLLRAVACCPRRTRTPPACARRAICCAGACISSASAASRSPTSR
jgi:hypothetical protein